MLVAPSAAHWPSFLEAAAELLAEGTRVELANGTLEAALEYWDRARHGRSLKPGRVPETVLWLVDGKVFLGRVSIRHELTDELRRVGGHIGFVIRPSRRREGHGTRILRLALPHARALGIDPALVTCDADNVASRTIIEAAGGVLDASFDVPGELRFWVPT